MKIPETTLILFLSLLLLSCQKKKDQVADTNSSMDTIVNYYPLDPKLEPYYKFKDNSYWVFTDTNGKVLDSLVYGDYRYKKDTTKTLTQNTCTFDIHESVFYTLKTTKNTPIGSFMFTVSDKKTGGYCLYRYVEPYPFSYATNALVCTTEQYTSDRDRECMYSKDSLRLPNGVRYDHISCTIHQIPGKAYPSGPVTPDVKSSSVWVAGIGMVYVECASMVLDYSLARYNVQPR